MNPVRVLGSVDEAEQVLSEIRLETEESEYLTEVLDRMQEETESIRSYMLLEIGSQSRRLLRGLQPSPQPADNPVQGNLFSGTSG